MAAKPSAGKLIGGPFVYHLAMPRAVTIMASVAMKGGMPASAIRAPSTTPATSLSPTPGDTITGRSVSAGYIARA